MQAAIQRLEAAEAEAEQAEAAKEEEEAEKDDEPKTEQEWLAKPEAAAGAPETPVGDRGGEGAGGD